MELGTGKTVLAELFSPGKRFQILNISRSPFGGWQLHNIEVMCEHKEVSDASRPHIGQHFEMLTLHVLLPTSDETDWGPSPYPGKIPSNFSRIFAWGLQEWFSPMWELMSQKIFLGSMLIIDSSLTSVAQTHTAFCNLSFSVKMRTTTQQKQSWLIIYKDLLVSVIKL